MLEKIRTIFRILRRKKISGSRTCITEIVCCDSSRVVQLTTTQIEGDKDAGAISLEIVILNGKAESVTPGEFLQFELVSAIMNGLNAK